MPVRHARGTVAEEAADALELGLDPADIAMSLGIKMTSVARALDRAKQSELALIFYEADAKARQRYNDVMGKTRAA